MIAIMTWKKELKEELKIRLDGSRVIDSVEELEDNIDYLDKVIISRHLDWSLEELRTVLKNLIESDIEIFYIKDNDEPEELRLLLSLGVKNILFDPISVEEIINKVENIVLFDDEDYLNGAVFVQEIEETEDIEEKKESKEEKDIIKIENTVDVEKLVKETVEKVQPVVTVKQESTFRFLLNYIQKLLSLLVILISIIIEYFMQIAITIIVLFIVNYYISEQGINSFPALIDEIMKLLGKIKAN
ncbi:hypothetical protein CACET_c27430 [Clostridium aceticum]|uniref:Uncharacterized protein n=1 Tax=Clostridium aceticum TaxID=84022 RepID=A0A0D8IBK2_9CLOT|nr:hypothetical protein [Clostridium aceticum]AKL96188.1 hypothetical protein CACET_c27430 [Clostridium aceticum]KJF26606.1 hypothetical protein TZ02_12080 [Clostridium aceticum]